MLQEVAKSPHLVVVPELENALFLDVADDDVGVIAAGYDVASCEPDLVLAPGERRAVGTGLVFELPEGYEMQVRPRSGLALKHGITLPNAPGTIDADYRGELKVILQNGGQEPFTIRRGERIAQLVFARHEAPVLLESDSLNHTGRGAGGFGSTGV